MFQNKLKEKHLLHDDNDNERLLDQGYKQVPMDLNSSPLEEYFRDILTAKKMSSVASSATATAATAAAAKPVSIPGTLTTKIHENKHYLAHTFPFMNDIQYQQQNTRQKPQKTMFIVGSLVEEKPPVPWPVSLLTSNVNKPHDDDTTKYRHLKNIRNENWPLQQQHQDQTIDNESDVFSMDEDMDDIHFNDSDFDNDVDIDENDL